jgi:hypothetical protein
LDRRSRFGQTFAKSRRRKFFWIERNARDGEQAATPKLFPRKKFIFWASTSGCAPNVNPAKHPAVKVKDGQAFVDWLISPKGQETIAAYKIGGEQLFFPNASH